MANDFTEKLFQSIDTIVSSRLKDLEYDQTIVCEVQESPEKGQGIYQVKTQSATMIAYSDQRDYVKGDFVHVLVPLGDYTQKKIILGKVKAIEEVITDIRPFERFAPVTENLNNKYGTDLDEYNFVVNKDDEKIIFNKIFNNPKQYLGYNKLGIKISIAANLKSLTQEVVSGRYRIKVTLKGIDLNKQLYLDFNDNSAVGQRPYEYIEMEDMVFINPYMTFGFCNQEKVFDIQNFALSSITISIIQQRNEEDSFKDQNGDIVNSENFSIKLKDIYCALGYECNNNDIGKEKLYAYPEDGLRYDSTTTVSKQVNARLIYFKRDNRHMPYGEIIEIDGKSYFNGWAKYIPDMTDIDEKFNIPGYEFLGETSKNKKNGVFILSLNNNRALIDNRFITSVKRDGIISSNPIVFINNDYIKNADLLDNIIGFSGKLSDNRESFNIYGLDNKLLNDYNENEIYYLIVSYSSVNGRKIQENDTISWRIPADKTMLMPVEGIDYHQQEDGSFFVEVKNNHSLYDYKETKTFKIPFRIKNIYNQNFINNTIICNFSFIDENKYLQNLEFSKSISFGFSGSEGSEYIYNLELYKEGNKIHSIFDSETNFLNYDVKLNVYDYNMEQVIINSDNPPLYKWLKSPENQYATKLDIGLFKTFGAEDRIIMAKHITPTGEELISYLPIGTLLTNEEYNLEGCKTISYDYSGIKPYYYKGEYKIYKKGAEGAEDNQTVSFNIYPYGTYDNFVQIINNKIKPYDVYIENFTNFGIEVKKQDKNQIFNPVLIFPVIIIQGQYSAMTTYIKSPIQINSEDQINKSILGYISTQKDGLIIGKRSSTNPEIKPSVIGLYNYAEGKQLFGLDETNGLVVDGLEDNLVYLKNGNLEDFTLNDCTGIISSAYSLVDSNKNKITVGSSTAPVYFSNGIPTVCTGIATTSQINNLTQQINDLKRQVNELINQLSK